MEIFAGHEVVRIISQEYTLRMVEVAPITYIGKAKPGALDSEYVWQIKRLDETSSLIIKYPDGDDRFNQRWSDYLTLSYI
jgi:hypothetical protein